MSYQILHGATAQPQMLSVAGMFDQITSVRQPVVQMFWSSQQGFRMDGTTPQFTNFPLAIADALWRRGQIYQHTWSLWDWVNRVAWLPADICAGKYDGYLHAQAVTLRTWTHPLFVRLDHEFNGEWSPFWAGPDHTPAEFVSVWNYVVELFRADGALNVTWVWCPNELSPVGSSAATAADKLEAWLPDLKNIDWTAVDLYNRGATNTPSWWRTPQQLIDLSYKTIQTLAPGKPMMIAELGCHPVGGDRNAWLASLLDTLPLSYPNLAAINYFNVVDGKKLWPLLTTDGSAAAWTAGLARGPYVRPGFSMPPDLKPIVPMQSVSGWGDPLGPLTAQVDGLGAQIKSAASDIATLHGLLDTIGPALVAADALAATQQSALESSNALLGKYADNVRQVTDGVDALRALQAN